MTLFPIVGVTGLGIRLGMFGVPMLRRGRGGSWIISAFGETVITNTQRGGVSRWPPPTPTAQSGTSKTPP